MISHRAVALAGALLLLTSKSPALAAQGCTLGEDQFHTVPWPEELGGAPSKMLAAALFQPNAQELLVLSEGRLSMLRDPMSAPRAILLATNVRDFTVLPPFDGLSRVAITTDEGLFLSTITTLDGTQGASLKFVSLVAAGSWCNAVKLDAASDDATKALIVGVQGTNVLRGKVTSAGQFNPVASIPYGFAITHLAAADAHSAAGVEVAVGDDYSLSFYLESSTTVSYITPLLASTSFLQVARIPLGADVRDSFGIVERLPTTDAFRELVETTQSAPIYSGALQVSHADFGAIGTQTVVPFVAGPTDMVFATEGGEFMALHGTPQVGGGMPFSFDFNDWALLDLSAELDGALLTSAFSVADFDGDGDGDLAVWGDDEGSAFVALVRNDCSVEQTEATVEVLSPQVDPFVIDGEGGGGGAPLTGETEVGVDVQLEVRQPPVFDGAIPTHVQVKIYVREYYEYATAPYPIQPDVSPDIWWEDILVVTPGTTTPTVTPHTSELVFEPLQLPLSLATVPEQLFSDNTLLYVELVPQIRTGSGSGSQSGELVQRANATVWVGSANEALMTQLICRQEYDEFSSDYCTDTGPQVTYVHRRKVLRNIPPVLNP
jgi:hypothetical protein